MEEKIVEAEELREIFKLYKGKKFDRSINGIKVPTWNYVKWLETILFNIETKRIYDEREKKKLWYNEFRQEMLDGQRMTMNDNEEIYFLSSIEIRQFLLDCGEEDAVIFEGENDGRVSVIVYLPPYHLESSRFMYDKFLRERVPAEIEFRVEIAPEGTSH